MEYFGADGKDEGQKLMQNPDGTGRRPTTVAVDPSEPSDDGRDRHVVAAAVVTARGVVGVVEQLAHDVLADVDEQRVAADRAEQRDAARGAARAARRRTSPPSAA